MNPTEAFWADLFGRLIVESSALMGIAAIVSLRMAPQWRRKVWQVALSSLLLIFAFEASGLHRPIQAPSPKSELPPPSRKLVVDLAPTVKTVAAASSQSVIKSRTNSSGWLPGIIWLAGFGGIA